MTTLEVPPVKADGAVKIDAPDAELPPSARITPDEPTYVPQGVRARTEGWSAPFLSSPINEPPHPMEMAKMIIVEFEPDPEAAAAAVPDPLSWEPGTKALAMVGDNRQMPTSQIFQEGMILLTVRFGSQRGTFTPYIWTSTDEAMIAGREMSGRPKTLCDHHSLEIMGSQARAVITRRGETLLRASITLEKPADKSELPFAGDWFSVRKVQMPARGKPALKQVIRNRLGGSFKAHSLWRGRGFVELPGQSFSAAHLLKPRSIGRAWLIEMSWDLTWGEIAWENWVPSLMP
jgi:hypothetical protein